MSDVQHITVKPISRISSDEACNARACAWSFVFECWRKSKRRLQQAAQMPERRIAMLRAMSVYPDKEGKAPSSSTPTRPERRGVSRRTVIEAAKEKVPTIDLADRLAAGQGGRWRKVGAEWVRSCVLPDHEDRSPSFTVNPEKNVFWCHGCLRGGDVIELARFAWSYEKHEVAMAAANLLHEFGREIPQRPASWFRKQERQRPVRDAIDRARFDHLRRRLFRGLFEPSLLRIEDPEVRKAGALIFWEATEPLAEMSVERMWEVKS
jgi:CHC2-type zinc finger protein